MAKLDKTDPFEGLPRRSLFVEDAEQSAKEAAKRTVKAIRKTVQKAREALETPKKRGRPATSTKPWEAEGISRRTYFNRQKKAKQP